jgi:tRNA (adenine57-N1/adenine58-N1)-methyltransferase
LLTFCAGFGEHLRGKVDAVFLDLPHPWDALPAGCKALKRGGRLASFSPCVEQVQRMCTELLANGFEEVRTFEVLAKESIVKALDLAVPSVRTALANGGGCDEPRKKRSRGVADYNDENGVRGTCVAIPVASTPGHTGFLTFATRVVSPDSC